MSDHALLAAAVSLLIGTSVGCEEEPTPPDDTSDLPALDWRGDRVAVGTDIVDEVCAGTLERLDFTLESIEAGLGLQPDESPIEFFVLETEAIETLCGPGVKACTTIPGAAIYVGTSSFDSAAHELVHARLARDGRGGQKPLFTEGIASAFEARGGCLASQTCAAAQLDDLLLLGDPLELATLGGYTAGADLVHGLLTTHGPEAVLAFMDELDAQTSPAEIRALYLERFGVALDDDFQAFARGAFDEYTTAQLGCDGWAPAPRTGDGGVAIGASMDCSSPDVVNMFNSSQKGSITWTFTVTPEQSGSFVVSLSDMDQNLKVLGCHPPEFEWDDFSDSGPYSWSWANSHDSELITLVPGQYQIRWIDDFDSSLNFELTPPCSFEAGGCAAGQQCTIWNECRAQVEVPAALGEGCEQAEDASLVCEAGSRCLGGVCVAECDATRVCELGQGCSRTRVCGATCDLLAQDCESGLNCQPSSQEPLHTDGLGVCVSAGEGGLLGACDPRGSECQAGLSCEPCAENSKGGCCVPLCDPDTIPSDCPEELAMCDPIRDGPVGVCDESH